MKQHRIHALTLLLLLAGGSAAFAFDSGEAVESSMSFLKDWHIAGQNTTRFEYYDENGYKPSSVYPYDASQVYNESRLSFYRQLSPYENLSLSSAALINGSQYRSTDQGFLFEDIRAEWEKGDGAVPFRVNLGDYTASLSYRTLQQNLKGVQIELQPGFQLGKAEQRHSLLGFFGMSQPDYRRFDFDRDTYNGFSWLIDFARYGAVAFHFVNNYREKDTSKGFLSDRVQNVWALTYEKTLNLYNQRIGMEAELDRFLGDYDTFNTPSLVERDKTDGAYSFNLNGTGWERLDYGFRFEQYGDHYRPAGGVITPDRRTLSWRAGGKVFRDIRLDGRWEFYRDRLESGNPLDTESAGLTMSGPVENPLLRDLDIYFDVFRESLNSGDRWSNVRTWNYSGQLNSAVYRDWNGHLGFNFRNADDQAFQYLVIGREYTADIGHPIRFEDLYGDARAGVTYRDNSGINASHNIGPFTSLSLQKGPHRVSFNGQYLVDDDRTVSDQDVSSFSMSGGYTFSYGPHRIGFDFEMYNRNPHEFVKATEDYRLGFTYTFSFDKPAGTDVRDFSFREGYRPPASVLENISAEALSRETDLLEGLIPGAPLPQAQAFLESRGLHNPRQQGDFLIYETRIFQDSRWRQRLVVEHQNGEVLRSIILLDLDPSGDARNAEELFERVRGLLLKSYGNPASDLREGSFDPDYPGAVNAGRLVRVTDWTAASGIVRLGIPSRFGKPVRIEIHSAAALPGPREPRWGLDAI